jgi:hypothetical protein
LHRGFLFLGAPPSAVKSFPEKNKPAPSAASRDFFNAILRAERPILSNKNNTEGPDDLDANLAVPALALATTVPGGRIARVSRSLNNCNNR